jgi:hypothetical protein
MGVYWFASSLKKDSAYISGEIKCEGLYEINISKSRSYEVRRVEIHGGLYRLNDLRYLDNQYLDTPEYKGYVDNLFYLYSSDGDRYRRDESGGVYALAFDPRPIFEYIKTIGGNGNEVDNNLSLEKYDQAIGLQELYLVLEEAIEEDYIVFFYWQ